MAELAILPHPGPLDRLERRVLGALVEKAKTTPDAYPLSLNALRTACNQKNNRFPQMELEDEQVERAADSLRQRGAVTLVQGDSRVERYRHRMYDWLAVEKAEVAVLAELLLRGAQTVGDLRGRAARMEPIPGLAELLPIVDTLVAKGLVEYLSPPGRGAYVAHTFYSPSEREKVCRDLGLSGAVIPAGAGFPPPPAGGPTEPGEAGEPQRREGPALEDWRTEVEALREEFTQQIRELREEVALLRARLGD